MPFVASDNVPTSLKNHKTRRRNSNQHRFPIPRRNRNHLTHLRYICRVDALQYIPGLVQFIVEGHPSRFGLVIIGVNRQ